MKKRILALALSLCMALSFMPTTAFAAEGGVTIGASGLCEHHTAHDETCGYVEQAVEIPCIHEHGEDCYTETADCIHTHTEDCYPVVDSGVSGNEATPSDAAEPICGHECSGESGCIVTPESCPHIHDEICGYAPTAEASPCTHICESCVAEPESNLICTCDTDDPAIHSTLCPAYAAPENPECFCVEKCPEDAPNEWCDVCGVQGAAACEGGLAFAAAFAEPQVLGDFSVIVNSGSATLSGTALELTTGGTYTVSMAEGKTNSEVIILITGSGSGVVTNITVNGVTCAGLEDISTSAVNFTLMGENVFSISGVAGGGPLTIGGTGSLTADNGINADNRHIIINSGTIIANGNDGEAGIGSAYASKGIVTINDGIVTATGGEFAAGIGGGNSSTGNVTINGGIIAATGDQGAASIGDGSGAGGSGTVVISGGIVTAFRGNGAVSLGSAGGGSSVTIIGGGFTIDPRVSGAYRVGWQTTGGNVAVKLNGTDIEAAGVNQTVSVIPTPNSGYELKGLYLLGSNDTAPTENHYIDTTAFRTNALGGSYDFDMPNQHVTVHAVFQQTASGESYPITTEVIGYPGARLYAYTGAYPYDAELNDAGAVTEAALYSTVDVMLDASTSDISINKLPLDYELVGLYLNPTDYPESHYIDSEAFVSNYMSWGEGQIYGGSWYRFMVLGPTHVVAVVAPTGGSVEFPQHAVIYNADGGSGEMPADTAAQGASFALPECGFTPPAGRQFKAWLINDVEYAPGDGVRFTEDTEVVAVWEDIPVAVTGLAITTQPRLSYTEGEALDLAALAVTATYSDGSTESLDYGDVTCSPAHGTQLTAAHNGQTITVTFGGKTARTNALVVSAATTGGDLAPHTHSLAYKYSDGAGHWQECSDANCPDVAGSKTATASHSYDNDTDTTCVCGYTRTIMPSHTHSLAYKYSDTEHWQECSITNCPDVAGSKTGTAAHSYDNDTDTTCVCGYTRTIDSGSTGGPGGGYTPPSDSDDDDDSGNDTPTVPDDEDDTPAVPPVPPVTVPVSGDENSIQVGAVVSGTTATIGTIDLSALGTVIGSHVGTGVVTIDLSGLNKAIDTVKLPTSAVKQITDAANDPNNDAESLEIIFTNGTSIEFDAKALGEKSAQAGGDDIAISIKSAKGSALNTRQQQTIGSRPAWGINITSGGNPISDIGGEMKIQTPYTLLPGEKAEGIVVFYVDDNGNKERCETNFNSAANIVSWTTSHNSVYMIGYEEPQVNPDTGGDTSEEIPTSPETGDDTPAYVTYTVQRGDTLWAIANKYGCTVSGIVAANSGLIKDPNLIYAGWQLKIPQAGATGSAPDAILPDDKKTSVYIVKQGDTLWAISKMYGCTVAEIVALNGELITDPNLIFAGWELKIPQD